MVARAKESRVAVFGGSFNPPHVGHLMVVVWLLATDRADEVWIVPAGNHPFGKELAPFDARLEMARAIAKLAGPRARVLDVEGRREGKSYTVDTLEALARAHPKAKLSLVVGTDILAEAPKWRSFERVKELAPLTVVRRGGVAGAEVDPDPDHPTPLFPDDSSTLVRERLARGEDVSGLVPAPVLAIVRRRGLYR